jgi:mono/diheme cytochrome c family protein
MSTMRLLLLFGFAFTGLVSTSAMAQTASTETGAMPHAKELVVGKCLQCHADAIWRDQRQDAKAWEATLYRMLARGSVWTGDEIKSMASYLAQDFGPNSPKSAPVNR